MDQAERFEKFRTSGQAAVRLQIALEEAFREDLPQNQQQAYRAYLRQRIRPAMDSCVDRDDPELLERLEDQGWMEGIRLEPFIRRAGDGRRHGALVWLLRRKQREFGFSGPDFSL